MIVICFIHFGEYLRNQSSRGREMIVSPADRNRKR